MEPTKVKVNYSDAVQKAVKQISGLQGKKNKIDTHYEYEKLSQLLADVQAGKLDKNMMRNDELYIKGLQLEYQQKYLGDEGTGSNASDATKKGNGAAPNPPAPKEDAAKGQPATEGTKTPAKPQTKSKPAQKPKVKQEPHGTNEPQYNKPKRNPFHPKTPQESQEPVPNKDGGDNSWPSDVRNKGNNTAKDGSVVVTGDGNKVIINGGKAAAKAGASTNSQKPAKPSPQKMLDESAKNYPKAFADGEQVADDLIGYTTTKEKQNAIRLIMKQQPATIMGFISGYNDNDTVMGFPYGKGGLLDQVDNEYGWTDSEKKEVFSKVINTTLQWAKSCGFEGDSNYESLQSNADRLKTAGKIDTEIADLLIKELVSRGTARAGI